MFKCALFKLPTGKMYDYNSHTGEYKTRNGHVYRFEIDFWKLGFGIEFSLWQSYK